MFQNIHLHLNERAVLVRNGKAVRALTPGRYTFFKRYEVYQWNIDKIVFHTLPVVLEALPSEWYENAPMSLLEAYGLGRPVIGTDIGGIPELIRAGDTGLIAHPADASDLARAMREMAALTPAGRAAMGASGRAWVARDFSPAAHRERLLDLYGSIRIHA